MRRGPEARQTTSVTLAIVPGDLVHVVRELVTAPQLRVLVSSKANAPVYAAGACVRGDVLYTIPSEWITLSVPFGAMRLAAKAHKM